MIFMPFPRFVGPIPAPPPFAITNVASMKHSVSSRAPLSRSSLATSINTRRAAPGLKAPMNGFVVRIALRQHVPLRAGVEYPQYSFENTSGSGSACVQDVHRECALPENDSGCAPTARLSAESSDIYSRSTPPSNFEIGSIRGIG